MSEEEGVVWIFTPALLIPIELGLGSWFHKSGYLQIVSNFKELFLKDFATQLFDEYDSTDVSFLLLFT